MVPYVVLHNNNVMVPYVIIVCTVKLKSVSIYSYMYPGVV